jgi:murein DD-endopeptidase MepM/ murein hydrolase activator NlpD
VAAAVAVPSVGAQRGSVAGAVPRLVFPLVAKTVLWDNYGDPRGNGRHAGIDMPNDRRSPLVAVEPGRVEYATSVLGGCMLYLYGRSGTMYLYIHLNNDLGPENDNRGRCVQGVAYSVRNGSRVLAGEQVGLVGDSGDQDGNPGLHFEVHPNGGADVSPFPHLKRATRLLFAAREGTRFSLALRGQVVAAGGGTLRLAVTAVRSYPGGQWLAIDPREVELAVGTETASAGRLAVVLGAPSAAALAKQARVAVFTQKATVTREALEGAPGALTASRISALGP